MPPHYLLTSTFYGNWLPGDPRGFVSSVRDKRPQEPTTKTRREHDQYGTRYDRNLPGLYRAAKAVMKGDVITINQDQAKVLLKQFLETSTIRQWPMLALAIMGNHIHIVLQIPDNTDPEKVLGDLKAYGSRALSRHWGKPASDTWWTSGGSKKRKFDNAAIPNAIIYTLQQEDPLIGSSRK